MTKLSVTMSGKEILTGLIYLTIQLIVLPALLIFVNTSFGLPFSEVQINFIFFCIDFLCVTILFRRFLLASAKQAFANVSRCLRYAFIGLLLYWGGSMVVSMIILAVYPDFSNVNDQSIMALTEQNQMLMGIGTVLLVPVVEETLYRGVVFGGLYQRSPIAAFAVSTLVFSALHVVGYIGSFEPLHLCMCFLQYIPAGLALAFAYTKADTIWAPILMHMTINQIGILAMR